MHWKFGLSRYKKVDFCFLEMSKTVRNTPSLYGFTRFINLTYFFNIWPYHNLTSTSCLNLPKIVWKISKQGGNQAKIKSGTSASASKVGWKYTTFVHAFNKPLVCTTIVELNLLVFELFVLDRVIIWLSILLRIQTSQIRKSFPIFPNIPLYVTLSANLISLTFLHRIKCRSQSYKIS